MCYAATSEGNAILVEGMGHGTFKPVIKEMA
jgi:hypothetical protein